MKTLERIEKEYENFKAEVLSKSKEKIYSLYDKISFYENIYEFILNAEDETVELIKNIILEKLYKAYLSKENINMCDYEEVEKFLKISVL